MAGDWIKFRKILIRDGRVVATARKCHADRVTVLGALVTLWCLGDDYCEEDGSLSGYTKCDLEREIGVPGLLDSLPADWFNLLPDGTPQLPSYQQHNGETAKRRAIDLDRQKRARAKVSRSERDETRTREEKRRVQRREGDTPLPPCLTDLPEVLRSIEFLSAWEDYLAHRKEIRKPLKPTGIKAALVKMAALGPERGAAAIRHSIANGWQGIFEEHENGLKPTKVNFEGVNFDEDE